MFRFLRSVISRRQERSLAELERDYLDACVSRIDLERREREIAAGLFRRPGLGA